MTIRKYFKSLLVTAALTVTAAGFTSCSDDDDPMLPGTGIENAQWQAVNDASLDGGIVIFEFESAASWTAASSESWCVVKTKSGYAGLSSLRLELEPNDGKVGRSADVTVQLAGYAEPCVLTIRQGDGVLEKGPGRFRDVNAWTLDIMKNFYLWNEPVADLVLDHSLDYDYFFTSILTGVAEVDDMNHDDGYWINGERAMFYSNLQSNFPLGRSAGETYTDAGLMVRPSILGPKENDPCGFAVMWSTPGSAAAEAGIVRGDFIDKVNGIAVTEENYRSLGNQLLSGNVTVDVNSVEFNDGVATVTPRMQNVQIGRTTYTDPAVYKSTVLQAKNGKKIGYLLYMNFHVNYDSQLLDIFNEFKAQGVSELVIDLRYNNGGHVLSSAVLGTLVAGNSHKDEVYLRTTYNAARTAAGEVGVYKIGNADNPEQPSGYEPIVNALSSSLGLDRVFVIGTENTASASELLINGLRGLNIKVNLVGTTTQGKNCGMEGWQKRFGSYNFVLYPLTFYCENAIGFRDYAEGFTPDLVVDDSNIYPHEFGTVDDLLSGAAIVWATTGNKPQISSQSRSAAGQIRPLTISDEFRAPVTRRPGGSRTQVKDL